MSKYNNLERIDKRLNQLEFYLRAKWFKYEGEKDVTIWKHCAQGEQGKTVSNVVPHLKLFPISDRHDIRLTFKYTNNIIIDESRGVLGEDRDAVVIRPPRRPEQYHKTWDGIDLIIGEYRKDKSTSIIYYIDGPLLLKYLDALYLDSKNGENVRAFLASIGIDPEDEWKGYTTNIDLETMESWGLIKYKDEVSFTKKVFVELIGKNHPERDQVYFIDRWNIGNSSKSFWQSMSLRASTDRSRRIIVYPLNQKEKATAFPSIKYASQILRVSPTSISDVLKRKQKTFKIDGVKFVAEYFTSEDINIRTFEDVSKRLRGEM